MPTGLFVGADDCIMCNGIYNLMLCFLALYYTTVGTVRGTICSGFGPQKIYVLKSYNLLYVPLNKKVQRTIYVWIFLFFKRHLFLDVHSFPPFCRNKYTIAGTSLRIFLCNFFSIFLCTSVLKWTPMESTFKNRRQQGAVQKQLNGSGKRPLRRVKQEKKSCQLRITCPFVASNSAAVIRLSKRFLQTCEAKTWNATLN